MLTAEPLFCTTQGLTPLLPFYQGSTGRNRHIIERGNPHGKFIILSFSDGEDAIFANTVTALASVADFSTVAASADAPLLYGSLQIDPQRRLVWQAGHEYSGATVP